MYAKPPKTVGERYEMTKDAIAKSVEPKLEDIESTAARFSHYVDQGALSLGQKLRQKFRRGTVTAKSDTEAILGKPTLEGTGTPAEAGEPTTEDKPEESEKNEAGTMEQIPEEKEEQ